MGLDNGINKAQQGGDHSFTPTLKKAVSSAKAAFSHRAVEAQSSENTYRTTPAVTDESERTPLINKNIRSRRVALVKNVANKVAGSQRSAAKASSVDFAHSDRLFDPAAGAEETAFYSPDLMGQLKTRLQYENKAFSFDDYQQLYEQQKPDCLIRDGAVVSRDQVEEVISAINDEKKHTVAADSYLAEQKSERLENALMVGAGSAAVASGLGIGLASGGQEELTPTTNPDMFDHLLQKDVPIDQLVIIAQHNAGSVPGQGSLPILATNQTMTIEDTLDKTPVRGFDLDLHIHNGEVVLNHGGLFDPLAHDGNIPRLDDVLDSMNDWLREPGNHDEILFLNFENRSRLPPGLLEESFGEGAVMGSSEYLDMVFRLGRSPTINEIRAEGYVVVAFDHGRYLGTGQGRIGFDQLSIDSIWEDRTAASLAGVFSEDVAAPPITAEDIDNILNSGNGGWVSLDQISENDLRFFKPEDRGDLALRPDLSVMGLFHGSDQALQSALLGFGTASAGSAASLALVGGAFQGYMNEKTIRNQDKLLPKHLIAMELVEILTKRRQKIKKGKKGGVWQTDLSAKITPEEVMKLYQKKQTKDMKKNTVLPGMSSTVSLSGSVLSMGMLFPALFPAFGGAALGAAGLGALGTITGGVVNHKRLNKAIKKAFEEEGVKKALAERVEAMNRELSECAEQGGDTDALLSKMVKSKEEGNKILKASTAMLSAGLVARVSGMGKYGVPALGHAAVGVGAGITGVLVALSATMNYRDRREKLKDLSQTTAEVLQPDYGRKQKRKFCLFGNTAFDRFLKKHRPQVLSDLGLPADGRSKDIKKALAIEGNKAKLEGYLRDFAKKEWVKDLTKFAKKQKPEMDFEVIRNDADQLKGLLKKYAVRQVGKFAHNDTFREGRTGTLQLAAITAFTGIFFLPLLGVSAGILGIGLGTSKGVAVNERRLFTRKMQEVMDGNVGDDKAKQQVHKRMNSMVDSWAGLIMSDNKAGKQA